MTEEHTTEHKVGHTEETPDPATETTTTETTTERPRRPSPRSRSTPRAWATPSTSEGRE